MRSPSHAPPRTGASPSAPCAHLSLTSRPGPTATAGRRPPSRPELRDPRWLLLWRRRLGRGRRIGVGRGRHRRGTRRRHGVSCRHRIAAARRWVRMAGPPAVGVPALRMSRPTAVGALRTSASPASRSPAPGAVPRAIARIPLASDSTRKLASPLAAGLRAVAASRSRRLPAPDPGQTDPRVERRRLRRPQERRQQCQRRDRRRDHRPHLQCPPPVDADPAHIPDNPGSAHRAPLARSAFAL